MGTPSGHGGIPAASAAQSGEKSFPADTGPSGIAQVSGLPDAVPQLMGSPVQPDIRQVTPIGDMGMGYREAGEGDPH